MDYVSLVGIAVGLSMDAFAVSVTNGAVAKKVTPWYAVKIALCFGVFQALMPMIGWLIGKAGENFISSVDHWVALILLCYIGVQMIVESYKNRKKGNTDGCKEDISLKALLLMGIATSIDALATGIILLSAVGASTVLSMLLSVAIIGMITFTLSVIAVYIGKKFGALLSCKAELLGGIVLVAIGIKIFVEHMFFS